MLPLVLNERIFFIQLKFWGIVYCLSQHPSMHKYTYVFSVGVRYVEHKPYHKNKGGTPNGITNA